MKNVLQTSKMSDSSSIMKSTFNSSLITNPIKKYFSLQSQSGSYGVELVWRIFDATRCRDNEEFSVFYFEKKLADKLHKPRRREIVCEALRKEVQNLSNVYHCKLLKVVHPLEENNESLAFATEKVHCSLSNLLGNHTRLDQSSIQDLSTIDTSEFNLKHGIYQIIEALRYLNTSLQFNHNNCSPFTILITSQNSWKLAGMGFMQKYSKSQNVTGSSVAWSTKLPKMAQPSLDYIAPEIQLESNYSETSDMFSLGLVICSIYSKIHCSLINAKTNPSIYIEKVNRLGIEFKEISSKLPEELRKPVEKTLSLDVKYRPNPQLFSLLKYFNDPVILGLESLLNLPEEKIEKRVEVLCSLRSTLDQMPPEILFKTVFKTLINRIPCCEKSEFRPIVDLLAEIVRISSIYTFDELLYMDLMDLIKSINDTQDKIDSLLLVDTLSEKLKDDSLKSILIPFVFGDLENADADMQIATFRMMGQLTEFVRKGFITEHLLRIFPKIYFNVNNKNIQEAILQCLSNIIDNINNEKIEKQILPFLIKIEYDNPSILMASLNILKNILLKKPDTINCQFIACNLMQILVPETVNPLLKITEFKMLMDVLHVMLEKIDKEYWRSHSSPNKDIYSNEESVHQVPRIEAPDFSNRSKSGGLLNIQNRDESSQGSYGMYRNSDISFILPNKDSNINSSQNNLIQPPITVNTKSSPPTPLLCHKQDLLPDFKLNPSTTGCLDNYTSLNVPLNSGRRHSFGSTTLIQNSENMITASVCEGPFFGSNNPPNNFYSGSRRPSNAMVPPLPNQSLSRRESSEKLTVIPISRRSSFNALSDTVMNLFHS